MLSRFHSILFDDRQRNSLAVYRDHQVVFAHFYQMESIERRIEHYLFNDGEVAAVGLLRLDNSKELARELNCPDTRTPLELFCLAFKEWRVEHLARHVLGDFAVVVWSIPDRKLYAFRDRLGLRNLYYAIDDKGITFSSSSIGLARALGRTEIDKLYFAHYLTEGARDPHSKCTPFRNIQRIQPGYQASIVGEQLHHCRYWYPEQNEPIRHKDQAAYHENLYSLLKQAVETRLAGVGPFWFDVSGGLDSTAILHIAYGHFRTRGADTNEMMKCRSIVHTDMLQFSEVDYIEAATAPLKLEVQYESFLGLPPLISVQTERFKPLDEPSLSLLALPEQERLSQSILASGSRIHLSGHGSDHLFSPPNLRYLQTLCRKFELSRVIEDVKAWTPIFQTSYIYFVLDNVMWPGILRKRRAEYYRVPRWLGSAATECARDHNTRSEVQSTWRSRADREHFEHISESAAIAADLITAGDRYGIDRRLPYTDSRIVEFVMALPAEEKVRPPLSKCLLRGAMRGRIPEKILIKSRQPTGDVPFIEKLKRSLNGIEQAIDTSLLFDLGLVNRAPLTDSFERLIQGDTANIEHFCRFISAELWLKRIASAEQTVADPAVTHLTQNQE